MTPDNFFKRYKYDLDKDHLGEGGFGKVFKAFDDDLDREVAIKIAEVKKGQESLSLQKEVELAENLPVHKNIAHYETCYRFRTPHGIFDYGILQYYPTGNLSQLIQEESLTHSQKESIAHGIIAGVKHLHDNDIVHRDLKSSNILMSKRDNGQCIPKIADFGLSKQITNATNSYFSNSFGGGSLLYAAPEQLTTGDIQKNVDLWSLGVLLYELFLGKVPFFPNADIASETGRVELVTKINSGHIPDELRTIPQNWQHLIEACLIPNAEKRVKKIKQVEKILSGERTWKIPKDKSFQPANVAKSERTEVAEPSPKPTPIPPKPVNRNWLWYAIGGFALFLLIAKCDFNDLIPSSDKKEATIVPEIFDKDNRNSDPINVIPAPKYDKATLKSKAVELTKKAGPYIIDCCSGHAIEKSTTYESHRLMKNNRLSVNLCVNWTSEATTCEFKVCGELNVNIDGCNPKWIHEDVEKSLYCVIQPGCRHICTQKLPNCL